MCSAGAQRRYLRHLVQRGVGNIGGRTFCKSFPSLLCRQALKKKDFKFRSSVYIRVDVTSLRRDLACLSSTESHQMVAHVQALHDGRLCLCALLKEFKHLCVKPNGSRASWLGSCVITLCETYMYIPESVSLGLVGPFGGSVFLSQLVAYM